MVRPRISIGGFALVTLLAAGTVIAPANAVPLCQGKVPTIDLAMNPGTPATAGNDVIWGSSAGETISGLGGNDTICGNGGDDTINGGSGNDVLVPGLDNDSVKGGDGADTVSYPDATTGVFLNLNQSIEQNTVGSGLDTLVDGVENVTGSPFDDLLGDSNGNNTVKGGAGNDQIFTRAGVDRIKGGNGTDLVNFIGAPHGITFDLGVTTEQATGSGKKTVLGFENVEGTPFADTIGGTDDANVLRGGSGADLLIGRGGNDVLVGADGADTLKAGVGNDVCDGGGGAADTAPGCENVSNVP